MSKKEKEFATLVTSHSERTYYHVRSIVGNHEDANDVVQSSFLKAWDKWDTFKGQSERSTWFYRIATNEALGLLRKNKKHIDSLETVDIEPQALPYFDSDQAEKVFHKALDALPPRQRAVFNLKYFEEKSFKEIADILDISVGSLKASYHHAVKKIKNQIAQLNLL